MKALRAYRPMRQGCSLGLDVSRPVFETSRSRLVNFVGTSRLGYKVKCLGLGHEGLVYSEHYAEFSTTFASFLQPVE